MACSCRHERLAVTDPTLATFRLDRPPFEKGASTDDLWLDEDRQGAVQSLLATVERRGHALVLGEPGVGKTTVLRALRDRLSPVNFSCHYLAFVTLAPRDFIRQLCRALELEPKATVAALYNSLQGEIMHRHREHRRHPVVVIDEAHLIPDRTLSMLHVLANFEWDAAPLVSFILVGLPELHSRLKLGIHRSLLTRLSTKVELTPASPERTTAYVRQRIRAAGGTAELFAPEALGMLHELTSGVLRSIDIVASEALRLAALQDVKLVDRALLLRAHRASPLA
jgi:general secretion pathway protein A